jgi:phosphatidylserine decarboxylase
MLESAPWRLKALGWLPRKWLSRATGKIVHAEHPRWLASFLKGQLIRILGVPTHEAEKSVSEYPSFGAFFARKLKEGARPISPDLLVSPCDGTLEQSGVVEEGRLLQCKGSHYPLYELLGDVELARHYEGGRYLTIYLAPHDYHRVHWPMAGKLSETRYISGDLWPVNQMSVEHVERLFCINERFHSTLTTEHGKMTLIMVGATNVGSMSLDHLGEEDQALMEGRGAGWKEHQGESVDKGDTFGVFNMGSTVILLLDSSLSLAVEMDDVRHGKLLYGQGLID